MIISVLIFLLSSVCYAATSDNGGVTTISPVLPGLRAFVRRPPTRRENDGGFSRLATLPRRILPSCAFRGLRNPAILRPVETALIVGLFDDKNPRNHRLEDSLKPAVLFFVGLESDLDRFDGPAHELQAKHLPAKLRCPDSEVPAQFMILLTFQIHLSPVIGLELSLEQEVSTRTLLLLAAILLLRKKRPGSNHPRSQPRRREATTLSSMHHLRILPARITRRRDGWQRSVRQGEFPRNNRHPGSVILCIRSATGGAA